MKPIDSDYHGNEQPAKIVMKHYQVEVDKNGCERCGAGKYWVIVANGFAGGTSYENEEQALELCDDLNRAFEAGIASMEPIAASATMIAHYARRADEITNAELSAKLIYEELTNQAIQIVVRAAEANANGHEHALEILRACEMVREMNKPRPTDYLTVDDFHALLKDMQRGDMQRGDRSGE